MPGVGSEGYGWCATHSLAFLVCLLFGKKVGQTKKAPAADYKGAARTGLAEGGGGGCVGREHQVGYIT